MVDKIASVVNADYSVKAASWVVSLVVKPHGKNPEHALLIVEGMTQQDMQCHYTFRRYDFVFNQSQNNPTKKGGFFAEKKAMVQKHPGIVIVRPHDGRVYNPNNDMADEERVLFFWSQVMNDLFQTAGCKGISWNISPEQAEKLHQSILEDEKNPPDYQISGEQALLPKSSSMSGHNCYTWARGQLLKLNDECITSDSRLKTTLRDLLAAQTSYHVISPEAPKEPTSGVECRIM